MTKINIVSAVLLVFINNFCESRINNVRFLDHVNYTINVIQATISDVESRGWSNLKLPDTEHAINETIFDWEALGTVTYTNGFLVSIQHLDIQQSTVQQVWSWTQDGLVDFQARVRLHNVVVGFDVLVNLTVGNYRYSGTYRHPIVNFDFSIQKDMNKVDGIQDPLAVSVTGVTPASTNIVTFLPKDNITDVLNTLYVRGTTIPGVNAWGPEVLTPILDDVVRNKIEFPTICYNCPA